MAAKAEDNCNHCITLELSIKSVYEKAEFYRKGNQELDYLLTLREMVTKIEDLLVCGLLPDDTIKNLKDMRENASKCLQERKQSMTEFIIENSKPPEAINDEFEGDNRKNRPNFKFSYPDVTYQDIVGMQETVSRAIESYEGGKKYPNYTKNYGKLRCPKTFLFFGPPG